MDIQFAIWHLVEHEGLRLPYDMMPGSFSGGTNSIFTQAEWLLYRFNPPQNIDVFTEADPDASDKPTWATLIIAGKKHILSTAFETATENIADEEAERICVAYIGDQNVDLTIQNEILYRLRAPATELAPKNTERDRLHARSVALVAGLATMTLAQLQAFDPTQDSHWAVQTQGN